jgi:chromosome segregation ATPase
MADAGMIETAAQAMTGNTAHNAVFPPDRSVVLPVSSSRRGAMTQHRDWRYEDEVHALRAQAVACEAQLESCKSQVAAMTDMLDALDGQLHALRWRLVQAETEQKVRQKSGNEADSSDE